MEDRSYHHGRLRTALLDEAERALRSRGAEGLSLRDLARQAGVSHAAPRRHFADKQALLDALGERGFARLAEEVRTAIGDAGEDHPARLSAVAKTFVHFAIDNAELLKLMFATKNGEPSVILRESATNLFAAIRSIIDDAQKAGTIAARNPEQIQLLFAAVLQGIATLATTGRVDPQQVDGLTTDAVGLFLAGRP